MTETVITGIPLLFILFALTLLGIAVFHRYAMQIALGGLVLVVICHLLTGSGLEANLPGFVDHLQHEAVLLANLFALLTGFAVLARHFEKTRLPVLLPSYLPDDWKGGFCLLLIVYTMSGFLDNIAAALIGGAMAHALYGGRVHLAFLVALVAAANGGGAWSVIGDTTTTMIWLKGYSPLVVLEAYLPSFVALLVFGVPASRIQQAYSPIVKNTHAHTHLDRVRMGIVLAMLGAVVATNLVLNLHAPQLAAVFPWIGVAVWAVILASVFLRRPDWEVLPEAAKGAVFLLSLVLMASLMPVDRLPAPTALSTFALGLVSSVFDNIPLTKLALDQGGYDWGFLAFAVGYGGSMTWFGSSAGVALCNLYPQARSVGQWLRYGWPVIAGYAVGYAVLYLVLGWYP
jgi:Na+/H+ antiporter NhaD/arsenite permease-like protein